MSVVGDILRQEDAVIAPMVAVSLAAVIATCGLATDVSVWYAQRRDLQSVTDAAALAAAPWASEAGTANSKANSIVQANSFNAANTVVSLEPGFYCPDVATPSASRFSTISSACGSVPAPVLENAVRVVTHSPARTFLLRALGTPGSRQPLELTATATATRINEAGLSVGAGVLDLNTANSNLPFVKAMLSALGANVDLTAASYQGLVNSKIDALSFLNGLATELNVTAGTYDQLLQTNATVGQVLDAAIGVLNHEPSTADVQAAIAGMQALRASVSGATQIQLGQLFDLGTWGGTPVGSVNAPAALHAGLDLYQLGTFALELSNGNHAVTIPSSTLGVHNLASLTIAATAIEPPQGSSFVFGPEGLSVHTAQVRLQLNLAVLNLGSLIGVNVPLYVEVAAGDARISSITCNGDPSVDAQVGVQAQSGLANIYLGQLSPGVMTNFSQPVAPSLQMAPLVGVNLLGLVGLTVSAKGQTSAQQPNLTLLTFCQPGGPSCDGVIGAPPWSDDPGAVGVPARVSSGVSTEALLSTLTNNLTLSAQTCVIVCTTPSATKLTGLTNVLNPVLTGVDGIVTQLLAALGAQIGYMDTDVTGVRCGYPVLVY